MKKIILGILFIVGFSSVTFSQEDAVNWQTDYEKAVKIAKKEKKPLLVFFTGSDWCGPCKMLTEDFFDSKKFKKLADENFIIYEADFPRNKDLITQKQRKNNYYLSTLYNVNSFPTIVVIDRNGNELGRKKSYNLMRDTSYHFNFLTNVLKDQM